MQWEALHTSRPKSARKSPANDAAKSLKETEKRIRAISKQIEKTGRLRNPKTGTFLKATAPNIRKVEKEILRDVKQSKRTLKAASKFVDTIKGFFKEKKKGGAKSQPKKVTPKTSPRQTSDSLTHILVPTKSTFSTSKVKSASKNTKQRSKTSAKNSIESNPRQRLYEVSELPEAFQTLTANGTLEAIEANADAYNELLRPGDVFGGKVGYTNEYGHFVGGFTHKIFPNIEAYIEYISHYKLLETMGDDEDKHAEVLDLLKIIRFKAPKKFYSGKTPPNLRINEFAWQANRVTYQKKKDESKKAFKQKMIARDKKRAIEDARLRGRVSALEIENRRLKAERKTK